MDTNQTTRFDDVNATADKTIFVGQVTVAIAYDARTPTVATSPTPEPAITLLKGARLREQSDTISKRLRPKEYLCHRHTARTALHNHRVVRPNSKGACRLEQSLSLPP